MNARRHPVILTPNVTTQLEHLHVSARKDLLDMVLIVMVGIKFDCAISCWGTVRSNSRLRLSFFSLLNLHKIMVTKWKCVTDLYMQHYAHKLPLF